MTKDFRGLIGDIYEFLENPESELSEDGLHEFLSNVEATIRDAFTRNKRSQKEKKLVASNIGLPRRRLWYALRTPAAERPQLSAQNRMVFLYGSLIENLVLLLAKETGHSVTEEQKRIEVNGVSGKKDCRIDGTVVDVKSASSFSFKKFANGDFLLGNDQNSDPFGYKYQLGLYMEDAQDQEGAFLVINKENGEMTSVILDRAFDIPDVHKKIEQARIDVEHDTPPLDKCYPEVPRGKSGNMTLHRLCTFCEFKHACWADSNDGNGLIEHQYADGKAYFTKLVKEPQSGAKKTSNGNEPVDPSVSEEPAVNS
jgi:hypothetical protein